MDPPKTNLTRRQSMPETILSGATIFTQNTSEQEGDETTTHGLQFLQRPTSFKRSDDDRFGRNTKRKSQSLYEAGEYKGLQTTVKDEDEETENDHFIDEPKLKNGNEEETELDFLLSMPKPGANAQTHEYSSSSSSEREGKNTEDVNVLDFNRSGPHSFQSRPKARKSVHEMRPSGGIQSSDAINSNPYELYSHGLDDSMLNGHGGYASHAVSSLPNFSTAAYDNFGFNPLNNIQPLAALSGGNVGAFQLNPLNQFNMYDQLGQLNHSGFNAFYNPDDNNATEIEMKKKRSRIPSSVYRGVSRCGKDNKFQARIRVHGKVKYLGRFKSEIEAAKCYDKHAIEYLGVNAQTNFPFTPATQATTN